MYPRWNGRPGDQSVGGTVLDHHRAKVNLILNNGPSLFRVTPLCLQFVEGPGVVVQPRIAFRVNQLYFGDVGPTGARVVFRGWECPPKLPDLQIVAQVLLPQRILYARRCLRAKR